MKTSRRPRYGTTGPQDQRFAGILVLNRLELPQKRPQTGIKFAQVLEALADPTSPTPPAARASPAPVATAGGGGRSHYTITKGKFP
jgi:hypothetical protein